MLETSGRLLRLLSLLQARRFWAGADLASRLEVTERTVRRDVDRLRNLGYPVESSVGVAGGYQLGAGATLPPLSFEDDEALAVSLGLRTAATAAVTGLEEASIRALAKLERVLPARLQRRISALSKAVVPLAFEGRQIDADVLSALALSTRDHQELLFRYADRTNKPSQRRVEPHGLVHTGWRWYLVAWDVVRSDWRTFRVDRIASRPEVGERFVPRALPEGDLAQYVSKSVATSAYSFRARIVIHAPRERVAKRIPPLSGFLQAKGKTRCVLESGAHTPAALAYHLAMLDEDFEIIDPPELVALIRSMHTRLGRALARTDAGMVKGGR